MDMKRGPSTSEQGVITRGRLAFGATIMSAAALVGVGVNMHRNHDTQPVRLETPADGDPSVTFVEGMLPAIRVDMVDGQAVERVVTGFEGTDVVGAGDLASSAVEAGPSVPDGVVAEATGEGTPVDPNAAVELGAAAVNEGDGVVDRSAATSTTAARRTTHPGTTVAAAPPIVTDASVDAGRPSAQPDTTVPAGPKGGDWIQMLPPSSAPVTDSAAPSGRPLITIPPASTTPTSAPR